MFITASEIYSRCGDNALAQARNLMLELIYPILRKINQEHCLHCQKRQAEASMEEQTVQAGKNAAVHICPSIIMNSMHLRDDHDGTLP